MTAINTDIPEYSEPYDRLLALYDRLRRLAEVHRTLLTAAEPDAHALSMARWRIAEAGRCRMEMLSDTVFPLLERVCAGSDLTAVRALKQATTAYRSRVSVHVSRWSISAIVADWPTYQRESGSFRAAVAERMLLERRLLLPLLRSERFANGRISQ